MDAGGGGFTDSELHADLETVDAGAHDAGEEDVVHLDGGRQDRDIGPQPSDASFTDVGPRDAPDAEPSSGCVRDEDCSPDELCSVVIAPDGERFTTACRPPDSAGGSIGGACVLGSRCRNGLSCVADRCREICGAASDCRVGEVCSEAPFSRTDLSDCSLVTLIGVCHAPCVSPRECGAAETCHPLKPAGPSRVANGICGVAYPFPDTGGACDLGEGGFCRHALCTSDGVCTERCGADTDCPAGFLCVPGPRWSFPCQLPLTMTTCAMP